MCNLRIVVLAAASLTFVAVPERAAAATVTAAYSPGHRDVLVNDYGTAGLGRFVLDTPSGERSAWCLEADAAHTRTPGAYRRVESTVDSPELDALLWYLERAERVDDDTAVAAAALIWFYAGARRSIGPPVWSDGARGFAPVSPESPEPWSGLAPFSPAHPVGLRSAGTDLDRAERRLNELHRRATAWRGPWTLRAGPAATFTLQGASGPIAGVPVTVRVETAGPAVSSHELVTDASGVVRVELPDVPDGATLVASADAPGAHQEWDGAGAVQRMATATNSVVTARTVVPPLPRHVTVAKRSTDPTIGVAGAIFELRDRDGSLVQRVETGDDGRAGFAPVDPIRHAGPYRIVETTAPPGLLLAPPATRRDLSTNPLHPTVVEVVDHPVTVDVVIRKRLSIESVGPPDRSGFEFTVTRAADGLTHRVTTGPDGQSRPLALSVGTYLVCESDRPDWAAALVDTGCRSIDIGPVELSGNGPVAIDYVNEVPAPVIDTSVADETDGDRVIGTTGGRAVDRVSIDRLVPATRYLLTGEIVATDGTPVGAASTIEFVAASTSIVLDLSMDVPDLPAGEVVVVQTLAVVADEEIVVARHDDLADPDQTLTVVTPSPSTTSTTSTSTTTTTTPPTSTTPTSTTSTSTTTTPPNSTTPTGTTPTSTTPTSTTTTAPAGPTTSTGPVRQAPPAPTTMPHPTTSVGSPAAPSTTSSPSLPSPTLPRTGSDPAATLLRFGDIAFVVGIALVAAAGFLPRRRP